MNVFEIFVRSHRRPFNLYFDHDFEVSIHPAVLEEEYEAVSVESRTRCGPELLQQSSQSVIRLDLVA